MKNFFKDALEPLAYLIYAVSVFIMLHKKKSVKLEVLFAYYLIATVFITIACYTSHDLLNRIIYNIFFFITISVFSYYFKSILANKTKRIIINICWLIHLVVFLKISVVSHQLFDINNHVYAITYLTVVVYALLFFEHVLRNVNESNILHHYDFWLVSGYLLYFLSCFFIILFYDNIKIDQRAWLWSLQNLILFLSSVFTIAGTLWAYSRKNS